VSTANLSVAKIPRFIDLAGVFIRLYNRGDYMNRIMLSALAIVLGFSTMHCAYAPGPIKYHNATRRHVIFQTEAYIFEYNKGKPVLYDTTKGNLDSIEDENGMFGSESWYLGRHVTIAVCGGGKITEGPELDPSLICFVGEKVSDAGLDFSCSFELLKKEIKEEFMDVKWGDKVSCSVHKGDYLMWVFIEPRLCPGCDKCDKNSTPSAVK